MNKLYFFYGVVSCISWVPIFVFSFIVSSLARPEVQWLAMAFMIAQAFCVYAALTVENRVKAFRRARSVQRSQPYPDTKDMIKTP